MSCLMVLPTSCSLWPHFLFWCVIRSMSGLRESHCPICRHPYHHFPTICQMLHFLLFKMYPVAYKRREIQILEYEKKCGCFAPQFDGPVCAPQTERKLIHVDASQRSEICKYDLSQNSRLESGLIVEGNSHSLKEDIEATSLIVDRGNELHQRIANGTCQTISVDDALCTMCKQLIYRPIVFNCGHVYCESCIVIQTNKTLKCQKCQSGHPGQALKVCLEFDNFLEEQFPIIYAKRKSAIQLKQSCSQQQSPNTCSLESFYERFSVVNFFRGESSDNKVHIEIGCDSCGMYPIIGDRYKCKDCVESMGYDLCGDCYNTCSKLPGRFNQQHTPEHKFEITRPNSIRNIVLRLLRGQLGEVSASPNASSDVSENPESMVLSLSDDAQGTVESGFATPSEAEEDQSNHQ